MTARWTAVALLLVGCGGDGSPADGGLSVQDRANALARRARIRGTFEEGSLCPLGLVDPCTTRASVTPTDESHILVNLAWAGRSIAGQPTMVGDPCGVVSYRVDLARDVEYNAALQTTSINSTAIEPGMCTTAGGSSCMIVAGTLSWSTIDDTLSGTVQLMCGAYASTTMFGGARVP